MYIYIYTYIYINTLYRFPKTQASGVGPGLDCVIEMCLASVVKYSVIAGEKLRCFKICRFFET